MSKAMASRVCQVAMMRQPAMHRRTTPTVSATAAAAAATTATAAVATRRGLATDIAKDNNQQHQQKEGGGADAGEASPVVDEASARREALLKRYGDRTASSGPVAIKVDPAAADAQKSAGDEANHNEIWGDYVNYMEHQRKKGWKT